MQASSTSDFTSQQDAAPAHTATLAQDWIATNCSKFIGTLLAFWPQTRQTLTLLIITSG